MQTDLHEEHSGDVALNRGIEDVGARELERGGAAAPISRAGELDIGDGLLLDASDELDLGGIEGRPEGAQRRAVSGSEGSRERSDGGKDGDGFHRFGSNLYLSVAEVAGGWQRL